MRTLHDINPLRMEFIKSELHLTAKNILDVGCGGGLLTESLAIHNAKVTGIDLSDKLIATASTHAKNNALDISYSCDSVDSFSAHHDGKFDLITSMEILEHADNPISIINSIGKLLNNGGVFIGSTITRSIKSLALGIIFAEYLANIVPKGTHQYEKFIKPSELSAALTKNNMQLKSISGIAYNPFSRKAKLTNSITVNYIFSAVKL